MRAYLIDDVYESDLRRIEAALDARELRGALDGLYYLPVPAALLTAEQQAHQAECGPHFMALETCLPPQADQGFLKLELLVRARNRLRCSCVAYAAPELQRHMMDYLDQLVRELDIQV